VRTAGQDQASEHSHERSVRPRRGAAVLTCLGLGLALVAGGCSTGSEPSGSGGQREETPELPLAPESARVDTGKPTFSNPTQVTNPLYPISNLQSALLLGTVERLPFRTETTLLPEPKTIEWEGQQVQALVSQYVAYLDGQIQEVALDWFAQADDGSVWYFGEDVFNYEDGTLADNEGTWLAGKDGPPGMIMPANPQVGNVYRPENIPDLVFEEVTVKAVDQTVNGPRGPVPGAIVVEELHMEGGREGKIFAPGYGEFLAGQGGEVEGLGLAVPTDALQGPPPAEVTALTSGASAIYTAAAPDSADWAAAATALNSVLAAWDTYRAGDVPRMLVTEMSRTLDHLVASVDLRQSEETRKAALDFELVSRDLELRYRQPTEIDRARFDIWARAVLVDAESKAGAAVSGDAVVLERIWDRFKHTVDATTAQNVGTALNDLKTAAEDEDMAAATAAANKLRSALGTG
jgi:hypothetical protein